MERSLLWSAFGLSVCGGLAALLSNASVFRAPSRLLSRCWSPLIVALAVFLGSLPSRPPFAEGHGLGWGFLIGTIAALLVYASQFKCETPKSLLQGSLCLCAPAWFASVAVAIAALTLRPVFIDALTGICFGWFCFTALTFRTSVVSDLSDIFDEQVNLSRSLLSGATFLTILSVASGLGFIDASDSVAGTRWIAGALVIATLVCLLITVIGGVLLFARSGRTSSVWTALVTVPLATLAAGRGFQSLVERTLDRHALVSAALLGLAAAAAVWWVTAGSKSSATEDDATWDRNALAMFVSVAAVLGAVNRSGAFGGTIVALMLWGGSIFRSGLCRQSRSETGGFNAAVIMATLVVLYRFFLARSTESGSNALDGEGTLLGLMAGALLPQAGASLAGVARNAFVRAAQGAFAILVVLAAFATCYVVWNGGSGASLMLGFCLSAAIIGATESKLTDLRLLWSLGCSLALCQWAHKLFELTDMTRSQRTSFGLKALVVIAVLFIVREVAGVIASRIEKSRSGELSPKESVQ